MIKVISGCQTGVDQAALDAALELGMPTDGIVNFAGNSEKTSPGIYSTSLDVIKASLFLVSEYLYDE